MTGENHELVEDIERIDISGGGAGEPAEDSAPEGEELERAGDSETPEGEEGKPNQIVHTPRSANSRSVAPVPVVPVVSTPATHEVLGVPQKLEGETDREFALRLEVTRLRGQIRGTRATEITGEVVPPGTPTRKEMTPEQKAVLEKYNKNPQDKAAIDALREVFPLLAAELGFVRADELAKNEFEREANTQLDTFLSSHPEYLPENDPGNILWDRFGAVYRMYRPPANAKEMAKLLDRVHREVFGIQAPGALPREAAAQRKVDIASHAGAPASPAPRTPTARPVATGGLRLDMLKGFKDEEIEEMRGGSE